MLGRFGLVLLLLCIHIHMLIACSWYTTACGLRRVSQSLPAVSPSIYSTYHYVVRCTPRSHPVLCPLALRFPLLSPLVFVFLSQGLSRHSFRACCCGSKRTAITCFHCLFRPGCIRCVVVAYSFLVFYITLILSCEFVSPSPHVYSLSSVRFFQGLLPQVAVALLVRCHLCTGSSMMLLVCMFLHFAMRLFSFYYVLIPSASAVLVVAAGSHVYFGTQCGLSSFLHSK